MNINDLFSVNEAWVDTGTVKNGKPVYKQVPDEVPPANVPGQTKPVNNQPVMPNYSFKQPKINTGTPPANSGPTNDPTLNQPLPPKDQAPKRGFFKGVANAVGQTAKGVGAVAGGVAGIGRAAKKGYAAGADAVGGPGRVPTGNTQVGNQPVGGVAGVGGNAGARAISSLNTRLSNIEQALANAGIQESIENGKYKVESKFLGTMI